MSGKYPDTFYRVAVKAFVSDAKGRLLLVKVDVDKWDLPGGGLKHGESPEDGIRRELSEELGVRRITIGRPLLSRAFWVAKKQFWLLWIVYEVKILDDRLTPGSGVTAVEYKDTAFLLRSNDERERFIPRIRP